MTYVVPTKRGTFEVRESFNTPKGPRSRTLATFRELTEGAIEKAKAKSAKSLSSEQLRDAARRVGAPVALAPADRAGRDLIAELARGEELDPKLHNLLVEALSSWEEADPRPDAVRSAAQWIAATPEQRGKTLEDLLLLADALPSGGRRGKPLRFPRLGAAGV